MPEQDYVWLPQQDVLSFEEIDRIVGLFVSVGVNKLRITGGEPLLRRELSQLIRMVAARPELREIAMTTNGVLLDKHADQLKQVFFVMKEGHIYRHDKQ